MNYGLPKNLATGLMTITGSPGAGMDLFTNYMNWNIREYFKNNRVVADRPVLLGEYNLLNEAEFKKLVDDYFKE
jgi:hypothetical protein